MLTQNNFLTRWQKDLTPPRAVGWMIIVATLILFAASSLRHFLFQSTAFDLGIVDQAVYLISQGQEPISSLLGFHILGNHVELINYLLALPYKIYPSVYWLFLIQSLALSLGGLFTWHLSIHAGLTKKQSIAMVVVYLLYPLVFNVNLFDFHREVIAVPTFLAAVLAARLKKPVWFCFCVVLILSCKAVLSLTVTAMGLWLIFFEKRRLLGAIAILLGTAWFFIATQLVIPFFSGGEAGAVARYSYLGNSVLEIAQNLVFQPWLIIGTLFSLENLGYLVLLFSPIIWGLSSASLQCLIPAIPCISLNLLFHEKDVYLFVKKLIN